METTQKIISYEVMKAILCGTELELRERLNSRVPSLRTADRMIPYRLESVAFSDTTLDIDGRSWIIHNYQRVGWSEVDFRSPGCVRSIKVKKTNDEVYEKLIKEYFRGTTHIKKLHVWAIRSCFPKNVRLHVEELSLDHPRTEIFQELKKVLVDGLKLKKMKFLVCSNTMDMFHEELVQNATQLKLQFPYNRPIDIDNDMLLALRNEQIYMIHVGFPHEKILAMAEHWISTSRPIGSTFFLTIDHYVEVVDIFELIKARIATSFYSKVIELGRSYHANSLTIPMNESSELVLHGGGKLEVWKPFRWTFRMEVMEKGATMEK